ncbi:cytochrome P450 27C1-like [Antedon mediterranea]|uniref:cytochrome P450 27C1-like n=1 Tax=Antedon mediterranea TaxID=105859 RepID=UPI003AF5CF7D
MCSMLSAFFFSNTMFARFSHRCVIVTNSTFGSVVKIPTPRCYSRPTEAHASSTEGYVNSKDGELKPFKSIPLAGLPFIGNIPDLIRQGFGSMHLNQIEMRKKHGVLYRIHLGPMETLIIADSALIKELMYQEDRNPIRINIEPWKAYRKLRGVECGLVTLDHEPWRKPRNIISKRMLRPNEITQYMGKLKIAADDFIDRMIRLMDQGRDTINLNQDGGIVPEINNEIYKWALESVAIVLFDVRLGCLQDPIPSEVQQFIDAIDNMLTSLPPLLIMSRWHISLNTKPWKKQVESWDTIWKTGMKYINLKRKSINENSKIDENREVDLLTYLIVNDKLSMSEICGNLVEFLIGGVDTTSNTLLWAMYELARNPECQEQLHTELECILKGRPLTTENMQNLPYLNCVIKETLRLHPASPNNSRIPQKDITIGGYNIPKGTNILTDNYAMSRNEEVFENANEFQPERWLRENVDNKLHAFASLPFGFGTRMCIGKRLAEMEVRILLSKICQKFLIKPNSDEELVGNLRILLVPEKNVPLRFVIRNQEKPGY